MWAEQKLPLLLDSGVNVKQDQFIYLQGQVRNRKIHILMIVHLIIWG